MKRTMYDSTDVADIPHGAIAVAGYVDGAFVTYPQLRKHFPDALRIAITVNGSTTGGLVHVVDCERGDATPAQAASWAVGQTQDDWFPVIYCNRSTWPEVKAALKPFGLRRGDVGYWIADWTGKPHRIRGAIAVQYANPDTSGGHYDTSTIYGLWPTLDPKPLGPIRRATIRRITRSWKRRRFDFTPPDVELVHRLEEAIDRLDRPH